MRHFLLAVFLLTCLPAFSENLSVIVPVNADPETLYASKELQEHLSKALKKEIKISKENTSLSGRKIYLGNTAFAKKSGIDSKRLEKEVSRIKIFVRHPEPGCKKCLASIEPVIPQNEKYNFIRIGKVTLTKNWVFFAHRTWAMQLDLDRYYRAGADNTFEVFVSFKFEGPAYVKDSKKPDKISVDRVWCLKNRSVDA